MRFETIVKNGAIVTATDTYSADVGISAEKISAIAAGLAAENAGRVIDASACYVMPGGIDVHTHLDMPFGGTTSADDFESGTIAAAFGGTTTLIDFAIQYKGQTLRHAFDTWMKKAQGKAAIDYAFHCIVTDLPDAQLDEMPALVHDGVSSFKLFMAYPGVFMLDDAAIFRAMSRAAECGGLICMHAENGSAIDVIVRRALAEGKRAPKYHTLTRPTSAESEATGPANALAEMGGAPVHIVHLSCNEALAQRRDARRLGRLLAEPLRPARRYRSRKTLRPLSAKGHHRRRLGRRPHRLRSEARRDDQRQDTSHARGLFHVRGNSHQRLAEANNVPRPRHHRERKIHRPPRRRLLPPPQNLRCRLTSTCSPYV